MVTATPAASDITANTVNSGAAASRRTACLTNTGGSPLRNVPKRISLVVPAYNESSLLPRLLDTVDLARQRFTGGAGAIEAIVADNGSTDGTAAIAAA